MGKEKAFRTGPEPLVGGSAKERHGQALTLGSPLPAGRSVGTDRGAGGVTNLGFGLFS